MNDRFLEDLKTRVDIVEVVRRYAELKKSGKNFMCRSPFRNERTPSFCVSAEKQFWYDFGVSEGGDVISFLEKIENVSFPEAVEMLADMAGVEVPQTFGEKKGPSREEKKDIFTLHEKAAAFFAQQLEKSSKTGDYLKNRGVPHAVTKDWQLGYGGEREDGLTKFLLQNGFTDKQIAQSGVAYEREFGARTMRDRFFGRLMIPIREPKQGKIIAFTGRDLSGKKDVAKYVNSPENPVYHKSSTLFGFDRARKVIREKDAVILVEGNFDVIAAHTAGFTHTVATCGTSLTEDHLRLLKRLTKNIFLAFDSDLAGKKATLRAVEMILKMGLNPFIIEITDGKDLDDLARNDVTALKKTIAEAQNALLFLLDKFATKQLDDTLEGEKKFLDSMFHFLRFVHRPVELDECLSKIAKKLNRAKSVIEQEFRSFALRNVTRERRKSDTVKAKKLTREQCFVGFLSAHWDFFAEKINEKLLDLLSDETRVLLEKKLTNADLDESETKTLIGWELHQENLYGEMVGEEILKRDAQRFITQLQREKARAERLAEAQKVKDQLASSA